MTIDGITGAPAQVEHSAPPPDGRILPPLPGLEVGVPTFVVFTTDSCPWCDRTKSFLQALHEERGDFQVAVVDANAQPEAFAAVRARTRLSTVPQVFLDGRFVGGWRELADAAKRGQLDAYLDGGDWRAMTPVKPVRRGLFRRG